ncbi:MAG: SGNH/GDSL hydrolase family protein [Oscillospiraceae bacterium]|nr:SGNH/GDSL hydrolase family protein [Oscillospiraceae bacterium]
MKKWAAAITAIAVTIASLWFLTRLLEPKYTTRPVEGALTGEYYDQSGYNDVLIIGDCEVYENISPITLWREYGISSYIRGSSQQLVWQSYYLLEEALKYDKPKVVVWSVLAMVYDTPQKEAYNRMTIDGMRLSPLKWANVQASALPQEEKLSYVFPLLRYHDRWQELTKDDFRYIFRRPQVSVAGYMMRSDSLGSGRIPDPPRLADYTFGDTAWLYLEKMRQLCEKENIRFVLLKAPSLYPPWYAEYNQQIADYAAKHNLAYYNALEEQEAIGLDWQTDTYDGGLHLNLSGSEKCAAWLGEKLTASGDIPDRRSDSKYTEIWQKNEAAYDALAATQAEELRTEGKVETIMIGEIPQ